MKINKSGVFTKPNDGVSCTDDTDLSDGEGCVNLSHSNSSYTWNSLDNNTHYFFAIYPYTNSGSNIDYKTDGTIPVASAVTNDIDEHKIIISEVADPSDNYNARFVEITNIGLSSIYFDNEIWYLSRQANGSSWEDVLLNGFLEPDSSIVISCNSSVFESCYGFLPDITTGIISGNGNDGYFLFKGGNHETGNLVDAYGVMDKNGNGEDWEYEDSRAYRIYGVVSPDAVWNKTEWIIESASVSDMTPDWQNRILVWTGIESTAFLEKNNWKDQMTTHMSR